MKSFISFVAVLLIFVMGLGFYEEKSKEIDSQGYLRIHIRANSNSKVDQDIKYVVKDEIIRFLTPKLISVNSKEEAVAVFNNNKQEIKNVAIQTLKSNGFSYSADVTIANELFPTRSYQDVVLEYGYYDAIIVKLGAAVGDNWWCVVYPPLCFVDFTANPTQVIYKSKLLEIIENFFK